jgi:hypothetical protein
MEHLPPSAVNLAKWVFCLAACLALLLLSAWAWPFPFSSF